MPRGKPQERPFRLEVWEMDPDLAEETWRQWSSYVSVANAHDRQEWLESKGKQARVVNCRTGEIVDRVAPCPVCGEPHEGPYDGSCLI